MQPTAGFKATATLLLLLSQGAGTVGVSHNHAQLKKNGKSSPTPGGIAAHAPDLTLQLTPVLIIWYGNETMKQCTTTSAEAKADPTWADAPSRANMRDPREPRQSQG